MIINGAKHLTGLVASIAPVQSGSGDASPTNVRPISGWSAIHVYVSPTNDPQDGTTYTVNIPATPGTVYGGTLDIVKGVLTVTHTYHELAVANMDNAENYPGWKNQTWVSDLAQGASVSSAPSGSYININTDTSHYGQYFSINRTGGIIFLPTLKYTLTQSEWQSTYPNLVVQICAPLSTPVTYQLTPQQIETLAGYNYITADCGDILSASYPGGESLARRRRALMAQVGGSTPTVHGTWEDLFRTIDAGTYASEYSVGEILPLDLGAQGVVNAKIVAFNTDNKSSSGKAPVTLVSQYLLATAKRFNPAINPASAPYDTGTGAIGGWGSSELRSYCIDTLLPLIPSDVRSRIVEVTKITKGYKTDGTANAWMSTTDKIWVPSMRETQNSQDGGSGTPYYGGNITGKQRYPNGTYVEWGTRTCTSETNRLAFNANGYSNGRAVTNAYQILIGFCIG